MKLKTRIKVILRFYPDVIVTPIMVVITIAGFMYFWQASNARNDYAPVFVGIFWVMLCVFVTLCWYSRHFSNDT